MNDAVRHATRPTSPEEAADALGRRSLSRQAAFLIQHLHEGLSVLDCGCGPGSITCDIAESVSPGPVTGIDISSDQIQKATAHARARGIANVSFTTGSVYDLPANDLSFDIVFAHALFQHLRDPQRALAEIYRVLKPTGLVALRSPDWGALFIYPRTPECVAAFEEFIKVHYAGGDGFAGSSSLSHVLNAGYVGTQFSATVEYETPMEFGDFAATKLEGVHLLSAAEDMRRWARRPDALFAQGWGEVVGRKPS